MADKHIGALPPAPSVEDDSLLVMEQQGTAMKLTGAQLKKYAKQGVELEFKEDLEAAQKAAERAEGAVKAVTDLTVSAQTLEDGLAASGAKTIRNGVFHLTFGLPRGEQGIQGPEGKTGVRGPKGDPGNGLTILGYYDTPAALEAAQPAPNAGDAYGVGTEAPYDIYVYDGENKVWKNNGPLSGGGSTILPENVVPSEGGAVLEIPAESFGDAPHTIRFDGEEELPLTAEDVQYSAKQMVKEAIDGLFTSVGDGKKKSRPPSPTWGSPQRRTRLSGQWRTISDKSAAVRTPLTLPPRRGISCRPRRLTPNPGRCRASFHRWRHRPSCPEQRTRSSLAGST